MNLCINKFSLISKILHEAQFMDLSVIQTLPKILNDRELSRAIRMAISAEHEAIDLYDKIFDSCNDIGIKKLIQDISEEEKVHVGELENLLSRTDSSDLPKRAEGNKEANDKIGI